MTASQPALNSFERILFWSAVGIGGLAAAIRLGALIFLYLRR
jgi:hypothetical protein